MKTNVGSSDRVIRFILGIVIILIGLYYKSWWGVIGVIPLFTAFVKWCPLYLPFGISTKRAKAKS